MKPVRARLLLYLLGAYLLLSQVVMPLLSPFRALGLLEPGQIRNMLLPPLFLAIVITLGLREILRIKTALHLVLILGGVQAMIVGLPNLLDGDATRYYFSHLFQIASAYVMLVLGWSMANTIEKKFWERFVLMALLATLVSSYFTLAALARNEVGRLYTPAYTFIFVAAYSLAYSNLQTLLVIGGLLISNKRGPMVAVIGMFAVQAAKFAVIRSPEGQGNKPIKMALAFLLAALAIGAIFATYQWALNLTNITSPIERAVYITMMRLSDLINLAETGRTLDEISAGRLTEVDAALDSLNPLNWLIGSGAGWSVTLPDGPEVQNLHFTPLSLVSVFGLPFTVTLYVLMLAVVVKSFFGMNRSRQSDATRLMAPLYLVGALIHSLFAYSLFIDWLVFFFAGVAAYANKNTHPR
ncbi:MAG: hypothetical protein JNK28_02965 [Burkholderiaceae bacterium]|nr:hypothetical protein [Burkholderiaceae bacterium]